MVQAPLRNCSFCLKGKDSVAKLVAGLGVYICNECVELCSLIIPEDPAPRVGGWDEQAAWERFSGED